MEPETNMYFRDNTNFRASLLQEVEHNDSLNVYKMRLPESMEIINPRNNFLAYIKSREEVGFDLLPLFDQEHNKKKQQMRYDFSLNDVLAVKWGEYQSRTVSDETPAEPPKMPSAKDVRFERQKIVCPYCYKGMCGKRMVEGPTLDGIGPVPIPGDVKNRYRAKLASIKAQRAKKPFK